MSRKMGTQVSIAINGESGAVSLCGRANVSCSVVFKSLLEHLRAEPIKEIFLFLESCVIMDSTFLGVLANQGARDSGQGGKVSITLVSPSERVLGLIENLGVLDSFTVVEGHPNAAQFVFQEVTLDAENDFTELTRTSLEAHRTLIDLNEANRARFEGVTTLLAKELEDHEKSKN